MSKWKDKCEEALEEVAREYQTLIWEEFRKALEKASLGGVDERYEDNLEAIIDEYADGVEMSELIELKNRYKRGWETLKREALCDMLQSEWNMQCHDR